MWFVIILITLPLFELLTYKKINPYYIHIYLSILGLIYYILVNLYKKYKYEKQKNHFPYNYITVNTFFGIVFINIIIFIRLHYKTIMKYICID